MGKKPVILIADSNQEHYQMIEKNLNITNVADQIIRFDNSAVLADFLFAVERQPASYVLIFDIDIQGNDGLEILRKIKSDTLLRKMPVVIFTSNHGQPTIDKCYDLGCSIYILKPKDVNVFSDTVHKIGKFLLTVKVPQLNN